jgi:hypothetical protein
MSWNYKTIFDGDVEISTEWIWERLRNKRNLLLTESDFRMVTDSPFNQIAWAEYRQALRDLPATVSDPAEIVFPEPPTA